MTKLNVSHDYETGLSRKEDIDALKTGGKKESPSGLPKLLTDAFNLSVSCGIGASCAWLAIKFFV